MTQTYRTDDFARWGSGQGFNLTAAQVDINFWDQVQRIIALEARPDAAAGIDHFEIVGIMMYVHMTDATVLGPYELPVATFNDRGEWAPETDYSKMDTFSINGGLYVVIFNHTSEATFDPGANDGAGHDYYQLMIQTPGSALPAGGAVGALLVKTTTTDFTATWGYTDASVVTFAPADDSTLLSDNVADALEEISAAGFTGDAVDVTYDPTASGLTATNVQAAIDEVAAAGSGGAVGKQTIWIPASAMTPRTTNGPSGGTIETSTNKNMYRTLDFDATTPEYAQFDIAMPLSWDEGAVTCQVYCSHAAGSGSLVLWGFDAASIESFDVMDVAFDTEVEAGVSVGTANYQYCSNESDPLAITMEAGITAALNRIVQFRIWRKAADDTLTVDARLHGVKVFYVTDAATDDLPP